MHRFTEALCFILFLNTRIVVNSADCGTEPIDFHFLLDASGSILPNNFENILSFVSDFIDAFDVASDKAQFGVTTFATNAQNQFWMNTYTTKANIQGAVAAIPYSRGDTLTEKGLNFVRQQAYTTAHGDRANAKNVLIVITDGKSSEPTVTKVAANIVHQTDIAVLAVGLENSGNPGELEAIASDSSRVFTVADWDSLASIQQDLQTKSCEEPIPVEPTECPSFWSGTNAVVVDGKCIRLFSELQQWQQAQDACAAEGTGVTLLELTSETLYQYVASEVAASGVRTYLGATDLAQEGTWMWTNSGTLDTNSPWWGTNQPDNFDGNENCLIMRPDSKLNDYICNGALPYYCEAP